MEEIFRIVKIVDSETIVINGGSDNGINKGDSFEIFEIGQEVIDPDTGESLGTLDTTKDTVCAVNVFPQLTICRHIIRKSLVPSELIRVTNKTLNVDATQISGGLSSDIVIKLGDKVRRINKE